MREQVLSHFLDNLSVFLWIPQNLNQLLVNTVAQRQLASRRAVDHFRMIRIDHDEWRRVSGEYLEILACQNLELAKEWALGHDIDSAGAHDIGDLGVRYGWIHLDAQSPQPLGVGAESGHDAEFGSSRWDCVPP